MESKNKINLDTKINFTRRKRKHYEICINEEENKLPEHLKERRKFVRLINPLRVFSNDEFYILSPLLIRNSFTSTYFFESYFENEEINYVFNIINEKKEDDDVTNK